VSQAAPPAGDPPDGVADLDARYTLETSDGV
jgi:hypothetical protein